MIAKVTNLNQVDYQELFAKAAAESGQTITDLPTYFKAIDALRALGKWEYVRIPLDEPRFVIDADSRIIEVPIEFSHNGLSVQGDHTAEVVYFEIDRFFDAMDLSSCDCFIQWRNANTDEGWSVAYAFDITEEKIIFGWILSDSITEKTGSIEFAIRFIKRDSQSGIITYSFSTLTATCAIKPALDMDITTTQREDLSDLMNTRPIYSGIVNTADGAKPQITVNLADLADLDAETGLATLNVTAVSPDGGTITYQWHRDTATITGEVSHSYVANIAGEYYVMVGNAKTGGATRWIPSNICIIPAASQITLSENIPVRAYINTPLQIEVANIEHGTVTYQWFKNDVAIVDAKNISYTPADFGEYYVVATNTRNATFKTVMSAECVVKAPPVKPVLAVENITRNEDGSLTTNVTSPTADLTYQWYSLNTGLILGARNQSYMPSVAAGSSDEFYCRVRQVVFAGTTLEAVGEYTDTVHYTVSN